MFLQLYVAQMQSIVMTSFFSPRPLWMAITKVTKIWGLVKGHRPLTAQVAKAEEAWSSGLALFYHHPQLSALLHIPELFENALHKTFPGV